MTVRITKTTTPSTTTLRIDGRLEDSNVGELRRACEQISGALKLDLSNLQSADDEGIGALLELLNGGAELTAATPYFELLLEKKRHARTEQHER